MTLVVASGMGGFMECRDAIVGPEKLTKTQNLVLAISLNNVFSKLLASALLFRPDETMNPARHTKTTFSTVTYHK